jgi:hypothetical protein
MPIITDGTGSGNAAKISSTNRLAVDAISVAEERFFVGQEDAFNINTGIINLTNGGSSSGLLYMSNTAEEKLIVITAFIYLLGNSTGGAGTEDMLIQVIANPTGGTLIDSGTAFPPGNRYLGSQKVLPATVLRGAQGSTITGGTVLIESLFPGSGRNSVPVATIVPPGSSVAVDVTPKASNTNQDVQIALAVYQTDPATFI